MNGITVEVDGQDSESNSKESQLEQILSENLRMIPDKSDEADKMGIYLDVRPEDDDNLHIQEHQAFIAANTLRPQFKSKLQEHIKKHQIAYSEKKRMGLLDMENQESDSQNTDSEDY